MANDRNTFAKRAREQAKKQKALEKRSRRLRQKEQPTPTLPQADDQAQPDDNAPAPAIIPFPVRSADPMKTI